MVQAPIIALVRMFSMFRDLLIQQHADEQRKRILGQQSVGHRILSQLQSRHRFSLGAAPAT